MEITCNRCRQTVQAENCYCPACGLPQLVYATEGAPGQSQPERWNEATRDAATIDWKPALRAALLMAVPAGLLSSEASQAGSLGLLWMTTAAGLAVVLYMRSQRPAWITLGAGARIGLVTGLLGGWLAFGMSCGALFVERSFFHQANQIDAVYKSFVDVLRQQTHIKMATLGPADASMFQRELAPFKAALLSPEGAAGFWTLHYVMYSFFLLLFAVAGGAMGARLLARTRRPEI
jgi:RNA polymerase subunit RPABC4/transcription elongation factor Spt4